MFKKALLLVMMLILTSCSNKQHTKQINLNDAKTIAMSYYPNSTIASISFNDEDTIPNYSINLTDDTTYYEIEVNAVNGSLTEHFREPLPASATPRINQAKAKKLALNLHPGEITEFILDKSELTPYYEVTINDGTYEYELEINALTGEVTELEQKITSH